MAGCCRCLVCDSLLAYATLCAWGHLHLWHCTGCTRLRGSTALQRSEATLPLARLACALHFALCVFCCRPVSARLTFQRPSLVVGLPREPKNLGLLLCVESRVASSQQPLDRCADGAVVRHPGQDEYRAAGWVGPSLLHAAGRSQRSAYPLVLSHGRRTCQGRHHVVRAHHGATLRLTAA